MKTKAQCLIGKKFGLLTVLEQVGDYISPQGRKDTRWLCQCDCGNTCIVRTSQLKSGKTKSCGCLRSSRQIKDLLGKTFGNLKVIERKELSKTGQLWLCQCLLCGGTTILNTRSLTHNTIKSCGCLSKKHGKYKDRLYSIYHGMKKRCYNDRDKKNYKNYGGRGITVCDEWLDKENGFMNFYNWSMQNGYSDELTIDRINNDGSYEPSNCRWVDMKVQANNTRNIINITWNNETHCIAEWSRILNIPHTTIRSRLKNGWSIEKTLTTPLKKVRVIQ